MKRLVPVMCLLLSCVFVPIEQNAIDAVKKDSSALLGYSWGRYFATMSGVGGTTVWSTFPISDVPLGVVGVQVRVRKPRGKYREAFAQYFYDGRDGEVYPRYMSVDGKSDESMLGTSMWMDEMVREAEEEAQRRNK